MRRALIGVEGSYGFAGLGELATAPQKEWCFVKIVGEVGCRHAQRQAVAMALKQLRENVAPEEITYELDPSHPNYAP